MMKWIELNCKCVSFGFNSFLMHGKYIAKHKITPIQEYPIEFTALIRFESAFRVYNFYVNQKKKNSSTELLVL